MTLKNRSLGALAGLLISISALAAPVEISGVKLEDSIDLRG